MANKAALAFGLAAVVGFLWWANRPAQNGTRVNSVAGIRG